MGLSEPRKIIMKLHVNRGLASAQQLRRALLDSVGRNMHLLTCVSEVLEQCEVCRPSDEITHEPAHAHVHAH